jgi:hypothetical protein
MLVPQPQPSQTVRICAVVDDMERVIFSERQGAREERPLDVTCDLAEKIYGPCHGRYRVTFESSLVPWVFLPLCVLLGVAMARAPDRPMGRDVVGLSGSLVLALWSSHLQRFWLVSQVLAVASVLAVIAALAYTLAANYGFRASNRG